MPYLDELREGLKLECGDVITAEWYEDLVKYLELLEKYGAVDYAGYIHKNLYPVEDNRILIGNDYYRIKEINVVDVDAENVYASTGYFSGRVSTNEIVANTGSFSERINANEVEANTGSFSNMNAVNIAADSVSASEGNFSERVYSQEVEASIGYFSNQVYVQGKRVIKDEDPIKISEFYEYAKDQIQQAIKDALLNLGIPVRPQLIGYQVDYVAPAMRDVFPSDLVVPWDGRIRIKVMGDDDFLAYLKFIPNAAPVEILATLNSSTPITANSWFEFDFTTNKDDKVNFRVFPTTKITIFIYNIPEA